MSQRTIGVLGGTGFVGQHVCAELARRRFRIRVLTRRRQRHRNLLVLPTLGLVEADPHSASSLSEHLAGCDAIINLVGILNQSTRTGTSFEDTHAMLPAKLVEACRYNGIDRLVHMSALHASPSAPSRYLRSKGAGEEAAHAGAEHGLRVTSFRPSVIFGAGDSFFNRFAALLAASPFVLPLACPDSRFAPVWVADVARVFVDALDDNATVGEVYELCGPRDYTLRELVEYTSRVSGHPRRIIPLGDALSKLQGRVLEHVPGQPFTYDNYLSLQVDSVCRHNGFDAFGIAPTGIEAVVPSYLGGGDRPSRYNTLRARAAGPA